MRPGYDPQYVITDSGTQTKYGLEYIKFDTFSGTSLAVENHVEYAQSTAINSLSIVLPDGESGFICGVNFTSGSEFTLIQFKDSDDLPITVKKVGSPRNLPNMRYNLVIWYDGSYYWCSIKAVA